MEGETDILNADSRAMRYSAAAVVIHWLSAALLIVQLWLGFTFSDLPKGPERGDLFLWHKTLGVTILLLALLRLAVRLMNPPPPFPRDFVGWQRGAAVWTHRFFYLLLIVIPLTGLAAVSSRGKPVALQFGLEVPPIPGITKSLGEVVGEAHEILVFVTIALLVVHVVAALKHQFADRGPLANRMWPFRASG